ncbi:MAG: cation:proton antiporter [Phocaeicola sp.]
MLASLAYIFITALALGYLCQRLKLPALIGMLLTGVLLGPYATQLLSPTLLEISIELRQIALVIILMRAGLALNLSELKKVGRPALLMCFVPACLEIMGMILLAPPLFGITLLEAAILGSVVAAVSPAIIVPKMLHLIDKKIGTKKNIPQLIMAAGSVDDVFVIVLFTSFTTLGLGGTVTAASFAEIPISIVTGLLLGVTTGSILTLYFKKFHLRDSIKLLLLISTSFLFLTAESALKEYLPLSGLLAVMTLGGTINHQYPILAKRISPKFSKLWIGAEILLFVLVGATVNLTYAAQAGTIAAVLIVGVLIFRMTGVGISLLNTNLNTKERLFCMIAYTPKATVQAAIGSLPLAMGLACGELVLTVAVLSILIAAPLGAWAIERSYKKLLEYDKPHS